MWGDDLQELLGLYDYGPALGMGEEFRGWDAYYFDVPEAPAPIALRSPADAPSLAELAPIAGAAPSAPSVGELASTWLESLGAFPSVTSRPTYRAEPEGVAPASVTPAPEPILIRFTKPTWFNSATGAPMYDDPLLRIANGQMGSVDPAGPYYGGVDPGYEVFALSDWAQTTLPSGRDYPRQVPSNPLALSSLIPKLTLPAALTNPAGSSLSSWLLPLALAAVAVFALRK